MPEDYSADIAKLKAQKRAGGSSFLLDDPDSGAYVRELLEAIGEDGMTKPRWFLLRKMARERFPDTAPKDPRGYMRWANARLGWSVPGV